MDYSNTKTREREKELPRSFELFSRQRTRSLTSNDAERDIYMRSVSQDVSCLRVVLTCLKLRQAILKSDFTTHFVFFLSTALFLFFTDFTLKLIALLDGSHLNQTGLSDKRIDARKKRCLLSLRKSSLLHRRLLWRRQSRRAWRTVDVKRKQWMICHFLFHHARTSLCER